MDGQVAKLRQAAMQAVPAARVRRIFDALARKAERGDVRAAAVVLPYLLGRPGDAGLCELEASADAAAAEAADLQGFGL